jgi:hypothetical protein
VGEIVARYGARCLLVTERGENAPAFPALFERVHGYLREAGVDWCPIPPRIASAPELEGQPDEIAAEQSCEVLDAFLKAIGMWLGLESLKVTKDELVAIADHSQVLGDYKNNPRIATRDEIFDIHEMSYRR